MKEEREKGRTWKMVGEGSKESRGEGRKAEFG